MLILLLGVTGTAEAKHKKHRKVKSKSVTHHVAPPKNILLRTHANVLLMNVTDNAILNRTEQDHKLSIASISKLMTIYTVIKSNQSLNEMLTVTHSPVNHTRLSRGMSLTRLDLIKLSLVNSDNLAAITLSENYPGGAEAFINDMNKNAKALGMFNTVYYEPTGLNPDNSSTLQDIAVLTNEVSKYTIFRDAAQTEKTLTVTALKNNKVIKIVVSPTSTMFGREGIMTIKTGFTNAAGFCITMLVNCENKVYSITVLGARSKKERSTIVEKSLQMISQV